MIPGASFYGKLKDDYEYDKIWQYKMHEYIPFRVAPLLNEAIAFMSVVKLSSYSVSSVRLAAPYDSLSSVLLIPVRLSIFLSLSPVIVLYERIMPELLESNWLNVSLPELISGRLSGIDI